MTRNIRPGTLRAYAFGVITGSFMTAAGILAATPAKADVTDATIDRYAQAVCNTFDEGYADFNGILGIAKVLTERGYTSHEAGEIIVGSVVADCPKYLPLLKRFANTYGTSAANKVA